MPKNKTKLKALGNKVGSFQGFDTFPRPETTLIVTCISDEVTANCPVTNQPDWYLVEIRYVPDSLCIESKSLKLYLHSFRNQGMFCEAMCDKIAKDIQHATKAFGVAVAMKQKARGGISIVSRSFEGGPLMSGLDPRREHLHGVLASLLHPVRMETPTY